MSKIGIYMNGNYAEILKYLPDFLEEHEFVAYCQNGPSNDLIKNSPKFKNSFYLYENFNLKISTLNFKELRESIPFNLFRISLSDKSHFKRLSGKSHEKVLLTMYSIMNEWFEKSNPDVVFIPIIESIDSMMLYDIAKSRNIKTICYCHARQVNRSFFSDTYLELLPSFSKNIKAKQEYIESASDFLATYRNDSSILNYQNQLAKLYSNFQIKDQLPNSKRLSLISRFVRKVKLKLTSEKWNQLSLFYNKFLVTIESFLVPFQKQIYLVFEKLYMRPLDSLPEHFDYFPLHFSPESSINTPAPFYIDQMRVIDEIMLNRDSNHILIVKEHPAMYLKRNFAFYKELKRKPFIRFINKEFNSIELIKKANETFSVTGTACMEAFLLNKKWKMLGSNFLSEFLKENPEGSPLDFISTIFKVSAEFVLYSPPFKDSVNKRALFARQNLINMSNYFRFYLENIQNNNSN
jgi:hypothetical protein